MALNPSPHKSFMAIQLFKAEVIRDVFGTFPSWRSLSKSLGVPVHIILFGTFVNYTQELEYEGLWLSHCSLQIYAFERFRTLTLSN